MLRTVLVHIIIRIRQLGRVARFVRMVMKVAQIIQLVKQILFVMKDKKYLVSIVCHVLEILTRTKQITNIASVKNVRMNPVVEMEDMPLLSVLLQLDLENVPVVQVDIIKMN